MKSVVIQDIVDGMILARAGRKVREHESNIESKIEELRKKQLQLDNCNLLHERLKTTHDERVLTHETEKQELTLKFSDLEKKVERSSIDLSSCNAFHG